MIEFAHVSKAYRKKLVVNDVSFEVAAGEVLGLTGPNGAGKTTLLRMVLGLVQPTAGTIRANGCDVRGDGRAAREQIGYLPQRVALYRNLSVTENLAFFASLRGLAPERLADVIALLRLEPVAGQQVRTLSGGWLQRVGLAQALLSDPPILILDEPTVSLDPQSVGVLKDLLRELQRRGKTIVLSSHVLSDVEELADRVAILHQGRLAALDSVAELARQYGMAEQLTIDLAEITGQEVPLAHSVGAQGASLAGSTLTIEVAGADKLAIMQRLIGAGVAVRNFHSARPQLEAICIRVLNRQVGEPS